MALSLSKVEIHSESVSNCVRVSQESLEVSISFSGSLVVSKNIQEYLSWESLRVSQESFEVSQSLSKSLRVSWSLSETLIDSKKSS